MSGALPVWARPAPFALILGLFVAIRLVIGATTELVADEAYYALWSLYPSLGYHDHPPLIAWIVALGRLVADNDFGVRLPAAFGFAILAAALYRMGKILFDDARTGALATIWFGLTLAGAIGLQVMTPDLPSTLFWTLALWAAAEFLRSRNANWWLAVGLFAGLGLLSKYTDLFLGAGLALWILASRDRRAWLRLPQLWAGGLLALLLAAPNIWWNAMNGWASFRLQFGRSSALIDGPGGNWAEFLPSQLAIVLPPLALLILIAIAGVIRRADTPRRDGAQLLALTALPLLLYFILHSAFGRVQANWTMPIWPGLTLLGAALALAPPAAPFWRRAVRILAALQLPLGLLVTGLLYAQVASPHIEIAGTGRTSELHAWRETAEKIAAVATREGAEWFATRNAYGDHAHFAWYLREAGDPRPVREIEQQYRFRYRPRVEAEPFVEAPLLLILATDPANPPPPPAARFDEVRFVETVSRDWGRPRGYYALYLARGLRDPGGQPEPGRDSGQ